VGTKEFVPGPVPHLRGELRRSNTDPQLEALGFPQRERRVDLELVETCTFSSRVVYLRYRVARNI
jgi:hypothetical protein